MILNAQISPQRVARQFKNWTRVSFQVRGAQTFFLAHELGESQNQNDGIQLTSASTVLPYETWWKGELWYTATVNNSPLNFLILGEADQYFHP